MKLEKNKIINDNNKKTIIQISKFRPIMQRLIDNIWTNYF